MLTHNRPWDLKTYTNVAEVSELLKDGKHRVIAVTRSVKVGEFVMLVAEYDDAKYVTLDYQNRQELRLAQKAIPKE